MSTIKMNWVPQQSKNEYCNPWRIKPHLYGESKVVGPEALIRYIKNERKYQTWEMTVIKIWTHTNTTAPTWLNGNQTMVFDVRGLNNKPPFNHPHMFF